MNVCAVEMHAGHVAKSHFPPRHEGLESHIFALNFEVNLVVIVDSGMQTVDERKWEGWEWEGGGGEGGREGGGREREGK